VNAESDGDDERTVAVRDVRAAGAAGAAVGTSRADVPVLCGAARTPVLHRGPARGAPIGFDLTQSGVDPGFREAVEKAVDRLRSENPETEIYLHWRE
jgi:hypothetical protein